MTLRFKYKVAAIAGMLLVALPIVGLMIPRAEAGKPAKRGLRQRVQRVEIERVVPSYDRPFPLGQVTDSFWETQQTNAEAADFIFHDHEFRGDSALLTPAAKRHLEQVALRLDHVPFVVVIERSDSEWHPELDSVRWQMIVRSLARMGVADPSRRVVVAESFAPGITAIEAERAYQRSLGGQNSTSRSGRIGGALYR